jgi:flagellar biosynthesis/type III secretory pathway chaperone
MEIIRVQYEKQYTLLKRRLEETEDENERLTEKDRLSSKELILYKNLLEAPDNPNSPGKSKDYQELKIMIDKILQENQHLYAELNHFKTSDPVYEQVQVLETTTKQLKQELIQSTNENNRLKKLINLDELKHLKSTLTKTLEECEQLRLINQKLLQEQTSSPKQVCE